MQPPDVKAVESHLPLKPLVFQVLLALADGERHGWSLVRDVQQRGGFGRIMPGNFYRTLRAMLADGLIEESPARAKPADDDERRRYFRLTLPWRTGRHGRSAAARSGGHRSAREAAAHQERLMRRHEAALYRLLLLAFPGECGGNSATTWPRCSRRSSPNRAAAGSIPCASGPPRSPTRFGTA